MKQLSKKITKELVINTTPMIMFLSQGQDESDKEYYDIEKWFEVIEWLHPPIGRNFVNAPLHKKVGMMQIKSALSQTIILTTVIEMLHGVDLFRYKLYNIFVNRRNNSGG